MRAAPERRTVVYLACLALAVACCARGSASADHADEGTLMTGLLRAPDARMKRRGQDPRLVAESSLQAPGLPSAGKALP